MARGFSEGQLVADRYRLVRLLGAGGMGAVWKAVHVVTERHVAIKVILADKAVRAGALDRFRREGVAAGKIQSRHVTQVLDAGTDPQTGAAFLVTELFEGEDVGKLIERLGPLPPQLALRIAYQALLGLHHAHEAGTVHRDVKPANLFLAEQPGGERVVKVLDFGIAKLIGEDGASETPESRQKLTATGMVFGSVPYMSPEQVRGSSALDRRTDVWSLGASLYEMLTGKLPFLGADAVQMVIQINTGIPEPLLSRAPWVPPDLAGVVGRAMCPDLEQRYPTALAMAEALEAAARGSTSIPETLVVALPEELRAEAAPHVQSAPPPPAARASASPSPGASPPLPEAPPPRDARPPASSALPKATATLASPQTPPVPRARTTVVAAAGLLVVIAAALVAMVILLSQSREAPVDPITTAPSGPSTTDPSPPGPTTTSAAAATSTPGAATNESAPTPPVSTSSPSAASPKAAMPGPKTQANPFGDARQP